MVRIIAGLVFAATLALADQASAGQTFGRLNGKISVSKIENWNRRVGSSRAKILCSEVAELSDTILCTANDVKSLALAMCRPIVYSEGGQAEGLDPGAKPGAVPVGTLLKQSDPLAEECWAGGTAIGYNLPGERVRQFVVKSERACASGQREHCLIPEERDFYKTIIEKKVPQVVLGVWRSDPGLSTVSHELLHARYYVSEPYRNAINTYFDLIDKRGASEARKSKLEWEAKIFGQEARKATQTDEPFYRPWKALFADIGAKAHKKSQEAKGLDATERLRIENKEFGRIFSEQVRKIPELKPLSEKAKKATQARLSKMSGVLTTTLPSKTAVLEFLGDSYNINSSVASQRVLRDEFQAYVLQNEGSALQQFREDLTKFLADLGLRPLEVK